MIIEGCILPVHFNEFTPDGPAKGDWIILTKSIALMDKMKERYDELKVGSEGKATLLITANLPASVPSLVQYA